MTFKRCRNCKFTVAATSKFCPNCGIKNPVSNNKTLIVLGIVASSLFLIMMIVNNTIFSNDPPAGSHSNHLSVSPRRDALSKTTVAMTWKRDGFGSIMIATFAIRNESDHAIKDITVKCSHYAKSGTMIDSNTRTIFDIVPAKSSKIFRDVNMGFIHDQANTSICEIEDLVVVE